MHFPPAAQSPSSVQPRGTQTLSMHSEFASHAGSHPPTGSAPPESLFLHPVDDTPRSNNVSTASAIYAGEAARVAPSVFRRMSNSPMNANTASRPPLPSPLEQPSAPAPNVACAVAGFFSPQARRITRAVPLGSAR